MSLEHVGQTEIANFAQERVNLPKEKADEYRAQVGRLKEKLEKYLEENPDFSLRRLMLSGSLAKGTALRSLNDIDLACYVSGDFSGYGVAQLLDYLTQRLRKAFPNFNPDQVQPQTYSVKVSFQGSGLDVDVVPIIYSGDPEWYGDLVSQEDGTFLRTNIPKHLEFIRRRKSQHNTHFAQVVRLVKFWISHMKDEREDFRFKSFMAELVLAKLADQGCKFTPYHEAMQQFFDFLAKTDLRERIVFSDYYLASSVSPSNDRVQIFDPVNKENNAARLYKEANAAMICDSALEAGDAIVSASTAITKSETVRYWRKVFGPSFGA